MGTCRRETNVLVITSSVRMLHWILRYTSHLGPAVALDTVLVVGTSSLEKGLVGTPTAGHHTDLRTHRRRHRLLSSGRETKTGGTILIIVSYNDSKGTNPISLKFARVVTLYSRWELDGIHLVINIIFVMQRHIFILSVLDRKSVV